jgi:hypothetical protein
MNQLRDAAEQTGAVDRFFGAQARRGARLAYIDEPEEEAA